MWFGALKVLNDDLIVGWAWFGMHPHQDMEIITIPTQWVLEHKDSMWNTWRISVDEVQVMSAGTWVQHSEYNGSPDQPWKFFQLWIETRKKWITPAYDQKKFDPKLMENTRQLVVSNDWRDDSLMIHQDAFISRVTITAWESLQYKKYVPDTYVYVFVISWTVHAWDIVLNQRDAIWYYDTAKIPLFLVSKKSWSAIKLENWEETQLLVIEIPA